MLGERFVFSPFEVWNGLRRSAQVDRLTQILVNDRAPRVVLGLMVGGALSAAGSLLQALTRNPLASPEITGVSAGAVAAVLAFLAFAPPVPYGVIPWALPVLAAVGGFTTAFLVYLLNRNVESTASERFILIGILVAGILTSLSTMALIFLGEGAARLLDFLSGSLGQKTWSDVRVLLLYLGPGTVMLAIAIPRANTLQLGEDVARSLGQRRELDRVMVLVAAVLLTTGAVAIGGLFGFVGLMGPHIARRFVGSDLRRLVPGAAIAGGLMVIIADFVARNVQPKALLGPLGGPLAESYLPAGVYITFFGVPFLISLIWRTTR
jgi:iron complex transport system permease protein